MKTLRTIMLAMILISATSCEEILDALIDNNTLITGRTWVFSSVSGFESTTNDFYAAILTGATWDFQDGGTLVTGGPLGDDTSTWSFNSDETTVTVDGEVWTIVELTASKFQITINDSAATVGGGKATLTMN